MEEDESATPMDVTVTERQSSLTSSNCESNMDEDGPSSTSDQNTRICILGPTLKTNEAVLVAAQSFGLPLTFSDSFDEDVDSNILYIWDVYEGQEFDSARKEGRRVLGPPAVIQLANSKLPLPKYIRPVYSIAMQGMVFCFEGFRRKAELASLMGLIHRMGGSVQKDFGVRITHLVASGCGGKRYRFAVSFRIPVVGKDWVQAVWDKAKDDPSTSANDPSFMVHKLRPFHKCKISFLGFSTDDVTQMQKILVENGGECVHLGEEGCTHVVIDDQTIVGIPEELPQTANEYFVVKSEWFWTTVQMDACADEKLYLFEEHLVPMTPKNDSLSGTPNSRMSGSYSSSRKRKRLRETVSALAQQQVQQQSDSVSPTTLMSSVPTTPIGLPANKRRSSVSDASALLSPDKTASFIEVDGDENEELPKVDLKDLTSRQRVFMELVQTEVNYCGVLKTIVKFFKEPLEDASQMGGPLLDPPALKIIFGHLPPIHRVHMSMLKEFRHAAVHWRDDISVGNILLKYSPDMLRAYPTFINFFENTKEMLTKCSASLPRFHAFLKIAQGKPECGRQTLQELLIRPVQRLPSISLLLNDLLKHTPKSNADHAALEKALARIKEVMTHINEDKRRTEGQMVLFDIFNEIENCPAHLVSSHRSFITRCDVVELSDSLCGKGEQLVLFLFSDVLEVCKKRSRSLKSPSVVNLQAAGVTTGTLNSGTGTLGKMLLKPYKHLEMMGLSNIKRVVDISETEECRNVFALVCRCNHELKERLYSFTIVRVDFDKSQFLKTLCRQMANNVCRADAENFLTRLSPQQLDIETSDVNTGTFSRAARFASKTSKMVGRALSFNRTPSKLKRAVSQMISPFSERAGGSGAGGASGVSSFGQLGRSGPAYQIGSCQSLGDVESLSSATSSQTLPIPSTPQPPRKTKSNTYGYSAVKRM